MAEEYPPDPSTATERTYDPTRGITTIPFSAENSADRCAALLREEDIMANIVADSNGYSVWGYADEIKPWADRNDYYTYPPSGKIMAVIVHNFE